MEGRSEPLILAAGLTRVYASGTTRVVGLEGIDLSVRRGELLVIRGESGSGKSTLLSLLAGLDRPTSGTLTVSGHRLGECSESTLTRYRRHVVGVVFQSFNLLPTLTVMENVCLPALLSGEKESAVRRRARESLHWLGMAPRLHHFPGQLSGGEMQRTAIARALINDPAIVLADEPTGNLDTRNGRVVFERLHELHRRFGRTVLIATHSALADPFATRRIRLKDGRVVAEA